MLLLGNLNILLVGSCRRIVEVEVVSAWRPVADPIRASGSTRASHRSEPYVRRDDHRQDRLVEAGL